MIFVIFPDPIATHLLPYYSNFNDNDIKHKLKTSTSKSASITEATSTHPVISTKKRNPNTLRYRQDIRNNLRLCGKEYTTPSGKVVRAKTVKHISCKCFYKCSSQFSYAERQNMLKQYLALDSNLARWAFLGESVKRMPKKRSYAKNSLRKYTLVYNLFRGNQPIQVCKQTFLSTFCVSAKKVNKAIDKMTQK